MKEKKNINTDYNNEIGYEKRKQQIEQLKKLPLEQREKINIKLLEETNEILEKLGKDTEKWIKGEKPNTKTIDEYYKKIDELENGVKKWKEYEENKKN